MRTATSCPRRPGTAPRRRGRGPPAATADAKVDLSGLRNVNLAGNLRIARLRVKGADVADLRAAVKANEGRLDVVPFSLRVHGGSVSGRVGLDARTNRVSADGSLSGIQLRRLLGNVAAARRWKAAPTEHSTSRPRAPPSTR